MRSTWRRAAVLAVLGGALTVNLLTVERYVENPGDFYQDYQAALRLLSDQSLYAGWFDHPPLAAVLLVPSTVLDVQTAYVLFSLFSLAIFAWAFVACMRVLDIGFEGRGLLLALVLIWPLNLAGVALGSLSLLISGLLLCVWLSARRGENALAGVLLALALTLKFYPGFLLVYFVAARRWKLLAWSAVSVVVLSAASVAVLGSEPHAEYFFSRLSENLSRYLDFYDNASLPGAIEKLIGAASGWTEPIVGSFPSAARVATVVVQAVLTITVLLLGRTVAESDLSQKQVVDVGFTVGVPAMLLASPICWGHYATILPLSLLLLYSHRAHGPDWWGWLSMIALCALPTELYRLGAGVSYSGVPAGVRIASAFGITLGMSVIFLAAWSRSMRIALQ